jgi:hypothetical protein
MIFVNGSDHIVAKAARIVPIIHKPLEGGPIRSYDHFIETSSECPHPEVPSRILQQCANLIVTQTSTILCVGPVMGESLIPAVKTVKAPTVCPDPEHAGIVLVNSPDFIMTYTARIVGIVPVNVEPTGLFVPPVQTVSCPNPKNP